MDPLSLTASILTVVGVGAQAIILLKKIASLKTAPPLALALNNELSDLRLNVLAIEKLFLRQLTELAAISGQEAAQSCDTISCVVGCLERANDLVVRLDALLGPLLALSIRSDVPASKKWMKWAREESKLTNIKHDLHGVRVSLNIALGILGFLAGRSTSMRLEAISYSLCSDITKIQESQAQFSTQNALNMETFVELARRLLVEKEGVHDHSAA